jgi:hypothetical protein
MPFDSEGGFVPADPSQWQRIRALPHIIVHPKPPPSDGIDDWFVPWKASDGPDDWFVPGDARNDASYPNDWFVPPAPAALNTGQPAPSPQPNAANAGSFNSPAALPDPFAAYWSLIPASRVGAMAWDPPNLPLFSPSFPTNNFPATTPPFPPPLPPGSRPPTLGVDSSPWSSTHSLPSPAVPAGGLLGKLATLGTSPPPPGSAGEGGLLGALATLGTPPPTPSEGGLLGALATLGTPSPALPASSLAGGSLPGPGRPASQPMPSTLQAFFQGVGSATRQLEQAIHPGAPSLAAVDSPAAEPLGWSDLTSPSRIAPKVAYQFAQSYPTLAGGVVGGVVGGRLGALAGPEGAAAGALIGGSLGAAALSAAQTLGPAYAAELQKTPNDPEGAWNRAWRQAEISGAFSGASWAVFPARFFQGPVKQLVFQIFGAQPALAVGERATRNIVEGKPVTEGLGEAYGQSVTGTLTPALGHKMVSRLLPTRAPLRAEGDQQPGELNPLPFKEGSFSIRDWTDYPDFLRKPEGPFRLLEGEDYEAARYAADRANQRIRRADPAAHKDMQVHEIHPVKFGGNPTDRANKIVLPAGTHRLANRWWDRLRWNLLRDKAKRS